ncbi:hypothetical protein [Seonamhaeicola marinus]|uniref:Uncharacterized protein n=1 Tax=Seonamhaeicola marinus TaxID=1912246 RepID=A0A5D0HJW1_9FLAO|nr:hypothetical protein [Seonamhaeicola marinus]TYA71674.1 hypothetical protein FUA24_19105 [Seonamhaeicola marinus]
MKYLNYILILLGAIVAMYANSSEEQNIYILIVGIIMLMLGVSRIARTIPSKKEEENFIKTEKDKDEL